MNSPSPTSSPRPRSRLGRVLRWIALVVAVLVTLLALWLTAENVTGRIRLSRWDREMRAKGERPALADLNLPPAGPKEQRRCPLIEAVEAFKPLSDSYKLASGGLPTQKLVVPGKAVVLVRQPEPVSAFVGWNEVALNAPHGWADLAAQVEGARAPLEALRVAAAEGRWDANLDYKQGVAIVLPHLSLARGAARWLSSAATLDLHEGRREAAVENVLAIANLGRAMREEPILISQLVRIAVDSLGMGTTWQFLQSDGWSDAQLQQLQQAWQKAGVLGELPLTFEGERALGRIVFAQLHAARDPAGELRTLINREEIGRDRPPGFLLVVGWCLGWMRQRGLSWNDELAYCRIMQTYVVAARDGVRDAAWLLEKCPVTEAEKALLKPSWSQRLRQPLTCLLTPALSRASLTFFRHETQREMTVAALALERFKLRHKSYPSRLEEMVSEFLPAAPRDFMDGKPLRYRRNADGSFALWSVGEDLVDDGGNPSPIRDGQKQVSNMWDARDFVWPQPATEEEVAAARKGKGQR